MACSACSAKVLHIFLRETTGLNVKSFPYASRPTVRTRQLLDPRPRSSFQQSHYSGKAFPARSTKTLKDDTYLPFGEEMPTSTPPSSSETPPSDLPPRQTAPDSGTSFPKLSEHCEQTPSAEDRGIGTDAEPDIVFRSIPPIAKVTSKSSKQTPKISLDTSRNSRRLREPTPASNDGYPASRSRKQRPDPFIDAANEPRPRVKREPWQSQKAALKGKFGEGGWAPRKRLSPDAIEGIRLLNTQYPLKYTTPVLAEQFKVSPEAIRRILKGKWQPNEEEEASRKQRWEKRGESIWTKMAELGVKPPKKWRQIGINTRDHRRERKQTSSLAIRGGVTSQPSSSGQGSWDNESDERSVSSPGRGAGNGSLGDRIL
ncbi:MAG: hypothetical protein M1819_007428 [Sarea resinae]|nr:MAG: hypothetical protein M1819_007428 [Sarea resinae]